MFLFWQHLFLAMECRFNETHSRSTEVSWKLIFKIRKYFESYQHFQHLIWSDDRTWQGILLCLRKMPYGILLDLLVPMIHSIIYFLFIADKITTNKNKNFIYLISRWVYGKDFKELASQLLNFNLLHLIKNWLLNAPRNGM